MHYTYSRLESGMRRVFAAQDFRHTSQKEMESTADFIRRLERTFNVAYGHDSMSVETHETILYNQLHMRKDYTLWSHEKPSCLWCPELQRALSGCRERKKRDKQNSERDEYNRRSNQEPKKVGGMQQRSLLEST